MSTREIALPAAAASMPQQFALASPGLSLRSNVLWMLTGNIVYAACQGLSIVALAKFGSSFIVGQFSLGMAIASPILMFTNLHLRAVQATDARRLYSFRQYLRLRIFLTTLGLLAIAGVACFGSYQRQTAFVVLVVAVAKGIETLSDIHYGLFQSNDRLDETGKSMMLRGILSAVAVAGGLYLTHNLLVACTGMVLVWLTVLLLFDVPRARALLTRCPASIDNARRLDLVRIALPLGLATTMAALNLNMPRYFIHAWRGERQLGIYSALAYSTTAMVLVADSLGHSAIPRLSRLYSADRLPEYRRLLLKLVGCAALLGSAGLMLARCFGKRLLVLIYGPEYAAHYTVFLLLILAAAIYCAACMFTSAITAARYFRIQAPIYVAIVGANALACASWVPTTGLTGAAAALVFAATVHLLLGASVLMILLRARMMPARETFAC